MAVKRETVLHVLTVGSQKIGLDQPVDDYNNIGDIVGIKKAGESDQLDSFQEVKNLMLEAKVVKFTCRLKNKKTNTILCAIDKASGARGSLRGKTLGGSTITRVTISRKRTRR